MKFCFRPIIRFFKSREFVFALALLGSAIPLSAATLEVCPTCEIQSIGAAIEAAKAGDRILVNGGFYKEGKIFVDKTVELIGRDFPILDGQNKTEIITVTANGVHIEGFQIQNVGSSYTEDRAGIRLRRVKNFSIKNNKLLNTFFGIYLEHSSDGVISNNEVFGKAVQEMSSGNAIHLWYCKNVKVEHNHVKGHRDGIYFEFVNNCLISNNLSENNLRYGLHFMFSDDDEYRLNTFRNNGAGVAVMFSRRIQMLENIFEENWGASSYGLLLKEINDAQIRDNDFIENTVGIQVEGSNRISYSRNLFRQNGWAVKMRGGCLDNKVLENNFIGNTFDLAAFSGHNNNTFDGNYWSEYAGYDLDRDGIGDVPYRPVKLFNYVVNQTPEAIVLMRSLFVDIINFSEKVSPVFTPADVLDNAPKMKKIDFKM